MSSPLSIIQPPSAGSPSSPRPAPRPEAPRAQYLELKANVHRKLLNRLNLEALASTDPGPEPFARTPEVEADDAEDPEDPERLIR